MCHLLAAYWNLSPTCCMLATDNTEFHLDMHTTVLNCDFGNCEEELPKKPVGRLSANCRSTVGRLSADCRPTDSLCFGENLSAVCRPTDGRQSANSRPTDGRQSADSRPTDGRQLANRRPTVGRQVFWGALLHNYRDF